jgi:type IV pilus assembly protein PilW
MYAAHNNAGPRSQRGVSIIELMVGMVIALLVGLVAASTAMVFTASQRQGVSAAGAATSSNSTMASIKEEVAQAGLGFFGDAAYLCPVLNFSVGATNFSSAAFSPLQITRAGNFDQLDFLYADQVAGGASVMARTINGISSVELASFLPVNAVTLGQAILLSPDGPNLGVLPCTVRSVTAVAPFADPVGQTLSFAGAGTGSRHNEVNFGAAPAYVAKTRVTLLGNLDWRRYRVLNGNLVADRPLVAGDTPSVLVRNVVAFQVEYGVVADVAGSTGFAGWQAPAGAGWAPLSAANVARLRAVRIGLLTRSAQPEKPNETSGVCEATTASPLLFEDRDPITVPNAGTIDWKCFRYRTASTVVPLRNWAMGLR